MKQAYSAIALGFALLAGSGAALAQHPGSTDKSKTIPVDRQAAEPVAGPSRLSYTYVELGYADVDLDQTSTGLDRYALAGSFLIIPNLYVTGGYALEESDQESAEVTSINLAVGYRHALSDSLDLNAELGAVRQDLEIDGFEIDDTGFQLGVGLRAMVLQRFELAGNITYNDVNIIFGEGEDDTIVGVSGLFHITPLISVALDLSSGSESQSYGLSGRLNF